MLMQEDEGKKGRRWSERSVWFSEVFEGSRGVCEEGMRADKHNGKDEKKRKGGREKERVV
jgi:hypothetical protein